jgi:hypothetical protein
MQSAQEVADGRTVPSQPFEVDANARCADAFDNAELQREADR